MEVSTVSNYILCSLRFHENGKREFADNRNREMRLIVLVMIFMTGVQWVMKCTVCQDVALGIC